MMGKKMSPIISVIEIDRGGACVVYVIRIRIIGSRLEYFEKHNEQEFLRLERIRLKLMLLCVRFRDGYFHFPFLPGLIFEQKNAFSTHVEFAYRLFDDIFYSEKEGETYKWHIKIRQNLNFQIFIRELTYPKISPQYLASLIVEELEKRTPFRRAIRFRTKRAQTLREIRGIRIQISGRLGGVEIARVEWTRKGQVPLHTICANLDYSSKTANTIYGLLGVKIWIFMGGYLSHLCCWRIKVILLYLCWRQKI